MTPAETALRALVAGLRGALPEPGLWMPVLEAANRCWLAPELRLALARSGALAEAPEDVRAYLDFLHGGNVERNRRLRAQLDEAVSALCRAGIEPTLLKGAAELASAPWDRAGARMMCDADLMVPPDRAEDATSCLLALGYEVLERGAPGRHDHATLGRPADAGTLDLHRRPPGPARFTADPALSAGATRVRCGQGLAVLPSPTARALHLLVHDQIVEGDHWLGRIDLRHMHDLARLAALPGGLDWDLLARAMGRGPGRAALETEAAGLADLFGVEAPGGLGRGTAARLRHRRRLFQLGRPRLSMPLRLAGRAAWVLVRRRAKGEEARRLDLRLRDFAARAVRCLRRGPGAVLPALVGPPRPKL